MTGGAEHLILSGGPAHDFAATTAVVESVAAEVGLRSTVVDSPAVWLAAMNDEPQRWSAVTCNALFWSMPQDRYAHLRNDHAYTMSDADAAVVHGYVNAGGGLLALHTAVICADAHHLWGELLGATWNWDRSSHPAVQQVRVAPTSAGGAEGSGDGGFDVVDELYQDLDVGADVEPDYVASTGEGVWPVVWRRRPGQGRVVTDVLGHDARSLAHPAHRRIIGESLSWLARATIPVGSTSERRIGWPGGER